METSKIEALPDGYECPLEDRTWYARAIGSLMYAMLGTRVDITYSVSVLSRYLGNPDPQHMRATKRIMRYLRGTTKLELTFRGDLKPLVGYTDSDWAGDIETRRSTSGFLFNIGSGAISWSRKRQPTVSLSSCEQNTLRKLKLPRKQSGYNHLFLSSSRMKKNQRQPLFLETIRVPLL